jgi:hypothetical protein
VLGGGGGGVDFGEEPDDEVFSSERNIKIAKFMSSSFQIFAILVGIEQGA